MEKEHFEILLEDMRSNFELVMERLESSHKELKREIQEHRGETQEKFDMIAYMLERLQKKDIEFEKRFDGIDQRLTSIDERFDTLEQKVDTLADDFAKHRANTEIHAGYTVNEEQKGHEYH
jgi:archaellum component FlaC